MKIIRIACQAAEVVALSFSMAMTISAHAPCLLLKHATSPAGMYKYIRKSRICSPDCLSDKLSDAAY